MHKQTHITLKGHVSFNKQLEVETKRTSFEDTEGVIRSRKYKKDRQHNGQKQKYKTKNNDSQNNSQQIEQHELMWSGMFISSTSDTVYALCFCG